MSILNRKGKPVKPSMRVLVASPVQDSVKALFAYDLAQLTAQTLIARPDIAVQVVFDRGSVVPMQRAALVKKALEVDATHILWLDSDMRFPPDALARLLAHKKPIVGVNYVTRIQPCVPITAVEQPGISELTRLFTAEGDEGLVAAAWAGMGVMLTEVGVFRKLPEPWFNFWWNEARKSFTGEDVFFCHHARHAGYEILIDQSLSQQITHIGEMEFEHAHAIALRDVLKAGDGNTSDGS
jgi:hypothetical protein